MRHGITFKGMVSAFTVSTLTFVPLGMWAGGVKPPWVSPPVPSQPPAINTISILTDLATTKVHISTLLTGYNRDFRGEWKADGDVILGVDLSKVSYGHVNPDKREAVVRLPQPHLIIAKVDHLASRELRIDAKVWIPLSSKQAFHDEVWWEAERKVTRLAQEEPGYAERAKVQAERVLETLFKGVGWAVTFEWDDPNAKDGQPSHDKPNHRLSSQPGLAAGDEAAGITASGPPQG